MSQTHRFSDFPLAFELGLTKVYRDELKQHPKHYYNWLAEYPAKHFFDTDWMNSGLGVMPSKAIGSQITVDKILNGPSKQHGMTPYAQALVIQYEVMRWDLYDVFKPVVRELPKSAVTRYNLVAYGFLLQAFTVVDSKYKTYQSEAACLTNHTRLDAGTWSNRLAADEGLSYEAIQSALIIMRKLVNERGLFVNMEPKMLETSVDQAWLAETYLQSTLRPGTADNDKNTLRGGLSHHCSPYLTQATYWFLFCRKGDPAHKVWMRLGDNPDLVKDQDTRTRDRIFTSYCSFEFATMNTPGMVGSTGGA